jgi:hypothetical protein
MATESAEAATEKKTNPNTEAAAGEVGVLIVHDPTVVRTPLLANSAAEFIENRIESSLGSHLSPTTNQHEFVAEFDAFVPKENIPRFVTVATGAASLVLSGATGALTIHYLKSANATAPSHSREKYFEQSKLQLEQFQKTLASFQGLLKNRNLERELGLPVKSPDKYTAQDVLQIAQKVAAKHKGKARHNDLLGHIRTGFRAVGKSSVIERLIEFAPTDVYGSAIYGSFTLILGVGARLAMVPLNLS